MKNTSARETPGDIAIAAGPSRTRRVVRLPRNLSLYCASAVIGLAILAAVWPTLFTSFDPITGIPAERLQGPSAAHWFGTDYLGRDLYARVIHGSGESLQGAFFAVTFGVVCGSVIGVVAGTLSGVVETVLMRIVDTLLSIPSILLSLSIIALLGFGTLNAAIAVGVTSIASFARLMRSEVLRVRKLVFVEAAQAYGLRLIPLLRRHILPNSITPVLSLAALEFGTAIMAIATLGFLGYGTPPPIPEWGLLVAEGRRYVATAWWLTTFPGLTIVLMVLCANRISQAIGRRDI